MYAFVFNVSNTIYILFSVVNIINTTYVFNQESNKLALSKIIITTEKTLVFDPIFVRASSHIR